MLPNIKTSSTDVRVLLPRSFTLIFSDVDLDLGKDGMIKINLIYHGICEKTNAFQLSLKPAQKKMRITNVM